MLTRIMMKKWAMWLSVVFLLAGASLLIGGCATPTPQVVEKEVTREVQVEVEVTREVEKKVTQVVEVKVEVTPEAPPGPAVPFEDLWASSPHADASSEAFRHWDEDDPQEVSARCAKCHSSYGYLDFLGADGTEAGIVDNAAAIDSVIDCVACHNPATVGKTSVVFPSGVEMMGLGDEGRCMECHQGRASKTTVDTAIEEAGLAEDLDAVSKDLGFTNIHYFAAAVTQYGDAVKGGYEYDGKAYDARFDHAPGYNTCIDCHDSHTLELKLDECATCHTSVTALEDLKDIRMLGSLVDYDGDGNVDEGIYYELETMQAMLYQAIQAYAQEVAGAPIVYDASSHPYWFTDTGENYAAWTARLTKAAYNYQTSLKDPGAYTHGGKYIIQLLYDSIEDLNTALSSPVDLSNARRIDHGHFAGSEEAFRHWDQDGGVEAGCARCHSAAGLPLYIEEGAEISQPTANGLNCATCHDDLTGYTRFEATAVMFPSGAELDTGDPDSNLCLNCHQGRASTASVNADTAGIDDDTVSEELGFINVHYFAAGATLFGSDAQGAYQYEGKVYSGRFEHASPIDTCTDCHDSHALKVTVENCVLCHKGAETPKDLQNIRETETADADYDGDGDTTEGMAGEITTLQETLYEALVAYSAAATGNPIAYTNRYPYWSDADGNRYTTWTPRLVKAAYNYQYVLKDPGGFAHNPSYILQILYDSLEDLGVDVTAYVRPTVAAAP
ncbi:MAG: hypothetical protein ACOYZ7_13600 [Chloroflexota bacterium]